MNIVKEKVYRRYGLSVGAVSELEGETYDLATSEGTRRVIVPAAACDIVYDVDDDSMPYFEEIRSVRHVDLSGMRYAKDDVFELDTTISTATSYAIHLRKENQEIS